MALSASDYTTAALDKISFSRKLKNFITDKRFILLFVAALLAAATITFALTFFAPAGLALVGALATANSLLAASALTVNAAIGIITAFSAVSAALSLAGIFLFFRGKNNGPAYKLVSTVEPPVTATNPLHVVKGVVPVHAQPAIQSVAANDAAPANNAAQQSTSTATAQQPTSTAVAQTTRRVVDWNSTQSSLFRKSPKPEDYATKAEEDALPQRRPSNSSTH
ncbi:MAG TPA: hypothetical protein VD770_02585 [Coxiellaceae bacterium]|nr:hypothetical protein [Coxiellaceae bacterium]